MPSLEKTYNNFTSSKTFDNLDEGEKLRVVNYTVIVQVDLLKMMAVVIKLLMSL